MATLSVPSPDSLSASGPSGRPDLQRPLSTHGMPKSPHSMSPRRPHRFSALSFPSPKSPQSSGPMSPPMSAKSFGTFIDSEPSTPAYSPRMDQAWDSSTVVLMRPMSSSSEPSTPTEPAWDMVAPVKAPPHYPNVMSRAKVPTVTHKEVPMVTSPLSQPPSQPRAMKRPRDVHVVNLDQRNDNTSKVTHIDYNEPPKSKEAGSPSPGIAPFNKLASKMKLMLRRKNTNEKKKEKKKREWEDVDRLEDVHWTEM